MPDSTSHGVVAVARRAHDGSLEASVESVERLRGESLEAALARAGSPVDGDWRPVDARRPADERVFVAAAQARLRAKLSYTNLGFALAPEVFTISELRELYKAALGHDVSATNLQRVLLRRGALERVEGRRAPGRTGGRPASLFRFASQHLEVTDEFAALRPPR